MARFISPASFDGAQMGPASGETTLTVWEKGADGQRTARELVGEEADEARIEILDLLGGVSDPGEESAPARKRKGGKETAR